jgi:hypothetical protein
MFVRCRLTLFNPTNNSRFMDLSLAEVTWFIEQVGLSATSFGVAMEDVTLVGAALMKLFGYKCSPATTVIPAQGAALQSICDGDMCPMAPNVSTCDMGYNTSIMHPAVINASLVPNTTGTGTGSSTSGTPSATGSLPATTSKAGAAAVGLSFAAVAGGLAAMFLLRTVEVVVSL